MPPLGNRTLLQWPELTGLMAARDELGDLRSEYERLITDLRETRASLNALTGPAAREAEAQDTATAAAAIRAGKPMPPPRAAEANRAAVAEAERRQRAIQSALGTVQQAVRTRIDQRGSAYLEDIARQRAEKLAAARAAYQLLLDAMGAMATLDGAASWLRGGRPTVPQARTALRSTAAAADPGASYTAPTVLEALGLLLREEAVPTAAVFPQGGATHGAAAAASAPPS